MLVRIKTTCEVEGVSYAKSTTPQNLEDAVAIQIINGGKGYSAEVKRGKGQPKKVDVEIEVTELSRKELNALAKERGIKSFGVTTDDLKKELGL